jgi:hypothetical protein
MVAGVTGRLVTAAAAQQLLKNSAEGELPRSFVHALDVWSDRHHALGPSASVRAITDVSVVPLLKLLGYAVARREDDEGRVVVSASANGAATVPVVITGWGKPLEREWRRTILDAVQADARWCVCCNGTALRIIDAHHTWSRQFLEFDLALLADTDDCRALLWTLVRADAMAAHHACLDSAAELSSRLGVMVCDALGKGVLAALEDLCQALARRRAPPSQLLFEQSLTVLYRVLFLLFAEARALVPMWHPVLPAALPPSSRS